MQQWLTAACGLLALVLLSACGQEQRRLVRLAVAQLDEAEYRLAAIDELYRVEQEYVRDRLARIPQCPQEAPNRDRSVLRACNSHMEQLRGASDWLWRRAETYPPAKLEDLLATIRRTVRYADAEDLRPLLDNPARSPAQEWTDWLHFTWDRAHGTPASNWLTQLWTSTRPTWPSTDVEAERVLLERHRRNFRNTERDLRHTIATLR